MVKFRFFLKIILVFITLKFIRNLRNVAGAETVKNWWDNGKNQIAFSRGNKG